MRRVIKAVERDDDGRLRSIASLDDQFVRYYEPGEWTYPPEGFPNAWLFVFDSPKGAEIGIKTTTNSPVEFWVALVERVKRVETIVNIPYSDNGEMGRFWVEDSAEYISIRSAPAHTLLANRVQLIAQVGEQDGYADIYWDEEALKEHWGDLSR